jgi:hypothetical protein
MEAVHRHLPVQQTVQTRILCTYLVQSTRNVSGSVDISVYPGNSLLACRNRLGQHVAVADCNAKTCYMAQSEIRNIIKVLPICFSLSTATEIVVC